MTGYQAHGVVGGEAGEVVCMLQVESEVTGVWEASGPRTGKPGRVALFRGHGSGSSGFALGHLVLWKML